MSNTTVNHLDEAFMQSVRREMFDVVHKPDEAGPWYLRWCTPDGHSRGSMHLTEIDPKADPWDHEAAKELARWMARKHPTFLWFVSNEQALVVKP